VIVARLVMSSDFRQHWKTSALCYDTFDLYSDHTFGWLHYMDDLRLISSDHVMHFTRLRIEFRIVVGTALTALLLLVW